MKYLSLDDFKRLVAPLYLRVKLMVRRSTLLLIDDSKPNQKVQVSGYWGEVLDGIERFQNYGFTAHPHPGAEAIIICAGGQRQDSIVVALEDRRYRLHLVEGEVALYDDQGQKIVLARTGILLHSPLGVRIETPLLSVTGNIIDNCDSGGQSMKDSRDVYDGHHHHYTGGTTDVPIEQMAP